MTLFFSSVGGQVEEKRVQCGETIVKLGITMVSRLSMKTRKPNLRVEHMASLKLRIEDNHQNAKENSRGENSNSMFNFG
jgi:hypothetical protein